MKAAGTVAGRPQRKRKENEMLKGETTRRQIKLAARKLFAIRGLDAVSIREIVKAAGQKNSGSVSYYFNSKDDLIRELISDTARLLDDSHNLKLDAMEAKGGPRTIRDIVSVLIHYPTLDAKKAIKNDYALRFLNMVMINHRDLVFAALQGGVDSGTRRCLAYLRKFSPSLPAAVIQQRLMLVIIYLFAAASSREAARDRPLVWRNLWGHPAARDNLIDTVEGILVQPCSPETQATLQIPPVTTKKKAEDRKTSRRQEGELVNSRASARPHVGGRARMESDA